MDESDLQHSPEYLQELLQRAEAELAALTARFDATTEELRRERERYGLLALQHRPESEAMALMRAQLEGMRATYEAQLEDVRERLQAFEKRREDFLRESGAGMFSSTAGPVNCGDVVISLVNGGISAVSSHRNLTGRDLCGVVYWFSTGQVYHDVCKRWMAVTGCNTPESFELDCKRATQELEGVKEAFRSVRRFWLTTRGALLGLKLPAVDALLEELPYCFDRAREEAYAIVEEEWKELGVVSVIYGPGPGWLLDTGKRVGTGPLLFAADELIAAQGAKGER